MSNTSCIYSLRKVLRIKRCDCGEQQISRSDEMIEVGMMRVGKHYFPQCSEALLDLYLSRT